MPRSIPGAFARFREALLRSAVQRPGTLRSFACPTFSLQFERSKGGCNRGLLATALLARAPAHAWGDAWKQERAMVCRSQLLAAIT
jgi:hypothetical protein